MITLLRNTVKVNRKSHSCFGCYRKFPAGSEMIASVSCGDGDGIWTNHICPACYNLMNEYPDIFMDDAENVYWNGCVHEVLSGGYVEVDPKTPEALLEQLRKETAEKR